MASLGELTAGIAHEIQNPLNFVNNFSEVNKEMLEELKAERLKPDAEKDDHVQDNIINDIIGNEEKIFHHGKRADAIVKSMLQHSRISTGQKQPTDINALTDEYLRLSYHGMRAKDKAFNVKLETDFDPGPSSVAGKIKVVPQDIGRVLLNLFNNAFYATSEKLKAQDIKLDADGSSYVPAVTVVTKNLDSKILISVKDNGPWHFPKDSC
jgi:signal transduction histidine kinase